MNKRRSHLPSSHNGSIPSLRDIAALVVGGFAGLGFWEVWANWPTRLVTGYSLEPPALVKELFLHQFGIHVPDVWAVAIHYVTGIGLYPAGFWLFTRIATMGATVDGFNWGIITYFFALGVFAPLAGLPFLLIGDNGGLSIMSLIGHAIYGYFVALVFEAISGRQIDVTTHGPVQTFLGS